MASFTRLAALAALLASSASIVGAVAASGSGTTTRYWDCCKPSCAWSQPGLTSTVKTCDINDKPLANGVTAQSGCQNGGTSFMCSDQSPWAINDNLAYGFAAVTASNPTCCQCYKLTFTSDGPIKGKTMIVQATNTGNDVSGTQFDLAMPGGGFGQFDGCSKEWKATPDIWGAQYGGSNTNQCPKFPAALQKGCGFRWDWMKGQSNPNVNYETVACPAEIVAKSGCSVTGYSAPQLQPVTIKPTTTTAPKTTTTPKANAPTTTTTPTAPKKASDIYSAGGVNSSVVDEGDSLATASMADGGVAESTEVPGAGDAGSEADAMGEEPVVEVPVVEEDEEDDTCEV
ncbi:MAG: hypothetical protein L6R36_003945 [Xanthoria steineri]|nr:MAG: hypothetical protein L6R36_003945 [Xanthoria steineri]